MEVTAGTYAEVAVQVIVGGEHVDPDDNEMTAVLSSHVAEVPTLVRHGVGRYAFQWANLDPALQAGQTVYAEIDGAIGGEAWTTYQIDIQVVGPTDITPSPIDPEETTADRAARLSKRVRTGNEEFEAHSLKEITEHERYKKQQEAGANPVPAVHRSRMIHKRP